MEVSEVLEKLSEPIPDDKIEWKVQAKDKERGIVMYVPYIDARTVIDRLNEVLGIHWEKEVTVQPAKIRGITGTEDGYMAVCKLTIEVENKSGHILPITREGVGEGKYPKDAESDALKRAALNFGVGRNLYDGKKVIVKISDRPSRETLFKLWRGEAESSPTSTSAGGSEWPATSKQISYIKRLLPSDVDKDDFIKWLTHKNDGELTAKAASEVIDDLKGQGELLATYRAEKEVENLF